MESGAANRGMGPPVGPSSIVIISGQLSSRGGLHKHTQGIYVFFLYICYLFSPVPQTLKQISGTLLSGCNSRVLCFWTCWHPHQFLNFPELKIRSDTFVQYTFVHTYKFFQTLILLLKNNEICCKTMRSRWLLIFFKEVEYWQFLIYLTSPDLQLIFM